VDLEEAYHRTRRLMNEHGLEKWTLKFTHAAVQAGCCYRSKKLITMSGPITELNEWAGAVENTALHEIAHALAPRGAGHGPAWKAMAIKVGAEPKRCYDPSMKTPPGKWRATCACRVWERQNKPRSNWGYWCKRCHMDLIYKRVD
jgi:predicted SprT family Zn-dependent metalloprotease